MQWPGTVTHQQVTHFGVNGTCRCAVRSEFADGSQTDDEEEGNHWIVNTLSRHPEIAIFFRSRSDFGSARSSSNRSAGRRYQRAAPWRTGWATPNHDLAKCEIHFLPDVPFAVGYAVGPQFFRGLKGDGVEQVIFATFLCVCCLATAVVVGKFLHHGIG